MKRHSLRRRGSFSLSARLRASGRVEPLEGRTLLCVEHGFTTYNDPNEFTGIPEGYQGPEGGGADIIWVNRNSTTNPDNFNVFGSQADVARNVVDAVLVAFERMIGDFNYSNGTNNYNVTITTGGNHNGASAGLNTGTVLNGLPKSGTVTMGRGSNGAGSGWFFDPTPHESSEFVGNIVNAFSGDAQAGSPASGLGDFYTVVAAEIAHCLGLYGSVLPGWAARTTNTNIPDTAEAGLNNTGSRGYFWTFQGPSIKHLLTSNNGGSGGSNWGSAVHAAGPGVNVPFGGDTYVGAQDIGNAVYEFSRRYIPNRTFSLMFKDAYNYSTEDPDQFGTFYAVYNETTRHILVRGGTGVNNDAISISVSGSTLTVSVDPQVDVPGTGHLPGAGNLPAFVSEFDVAQVSSITLNAGDGNDTIDINGLPAGVSLTINPGNGNDAINVNETDAGATVVVSGSSGSDALSINADGAGSAAADVNGTVSLAVLNLGAGGTLGGGGSLTVTNTFDWSGGTIAGSGSITIAASATLNVAGAGLRRSDRAMVLNGSASTESGVNMVLRVPELTLGAGAALNLKDNALIVDYTGASPIASIRSALTSGHAGGTWSGPGINSSSAAANLGHALGYAEAGDLFANFPAPFAGQSVDDTSVLVRYTRAGDANLDGTVNLLDFNRLAGSFGASNALWSQGNFNYDNETNLLDFNLLASNFGLPAAAVGRGSDQRSDNQRRADGQDDLLA
jgi:hypothetical protein